MDLLSNPLRPMLQAEEWADGEARAGQLEREPEQGGAAAQSA
jgi:hypothetical protein